MVVLKLLLEELKNSKYNDLEDMVYRFQLTYDEIIKLDILDLKYIPTKRIGDSIPPGMYGILDMKFKLKHLLPKQVKVDISVDDIRLESNLKINQTLIFTEKSLFIQF